MFNLIFVNFDIFLKCHVRYAVSVFYVLSQHLQLFSSLIFLANQNSLFLLQSVLHIFWSYCSVCSLLTYSKIFLNEGIFLMVPFRSALCRNTSFWYHTWSIWSWWTRSVSLWKKFLRAIASHTHGRWLVLVWPRIIARWPITTIRHFKLRWNSFKWGQTSFKILKRTFIFFRTSRWRQSIQ